MHPYQSSGVVGLSGRFPHHETTPPRSADLRLAGRSVPVLSPARVYVCGITPYDVTHLGHAATFVWADALTSALRLAHVDTISCRNVTDIDDVLTAAASTRGRHYDQFALMQEFLFDRDMKTLGVRDPTHAPHARHHVGQVVELAAALLTTGAAYEREGHVYFRGAPALAHAGLDREEALRLSTEYGDRPGDPLRDDPFDVPVWRPSAEQDPAWPSPWGWGRPGWHAECAAMAWSGLGAGIDVLVGGDDLAFPHHAYQAAMVEAASSVRPFARTEMHIGTVYKDGTKMAKSTGNLVLVSDLLEQHSPAAVRLLLLGRPWQEPWEFTDRALADAAAQLESLYSAASRPDPTPAAAAEVIGALLDDLDVPRAVATAQDAGGSATRLLLDALTLS